MTAPPPLTPRRLYLGIDAGNTKTIALIADPTGQIVGWGRGGPCNIYVSKKDALAALDRAVLTALEVAGVPADALSSSVLSAAGADWPEDFVLLRAELERRGWGRRAQVVNDAVGALWAAAPDGTGVMVVCGTSAGIAARHPGGQTWHSSYWQESEGADELGLKTLRAVYRAELGLDPSTTLTGRVLEHFAASSVEAVLHHHTRRGKRTRPPGRLARILLDEAERGDPTASRIVREHASSLGDYARVAARKVGFEGGYSLMMAGGVTRHPSRLMQKGVLERVLRDASAVTLLESALEPVVGAVRLALGVEGALEWAEIHAALEESMPHPSLFET